MTGEPNSVKPGEASKNSKKTPLPPLVKFNRAFKLAEQWVSKMSYLAEDDKSSNSKIESRPPRLGVGAAVPRVTQVVRSNDPVERKITTILETQKRRGLKNAQELADSAKPGSFSDDSDEEEESKAKAFEKKRPLPGASNLQAKKKQR